MALNILQENEKYIKELPREFLLYQPYLKINDFLMQALVIEKKENESIRGISYKIFKTIDLNRYRLFKKDTVYVDLKNIFELYYCDIIKNIEIKYPTDYNNVKVILDNGNGIIEMPLQNIIYKFYLTLKLKFENVEDINHIDVVFTIYLLDCELRKEIMAVSG